MLRRWLAALRELVTQERRDADLDRELRAHLDAEAAERLEEGTPADEARYAAKRALGHVPTIEAVTKLMLAAGLSTAGERPPIVDIYEKQPEPPRPAQK